jgi:two-component system chemotaxis response regulator CheB
MARQATSKHKTRKRPQFRHDGEPSVFTCPDCQGTLFIVRQGDLVRFRCRIGHLYSPESMMEAQNDNVERLMWSATRALEEQAEYIQQMANQIAKASDSGESRQYQAKSRSAMDKAGAVRKLLDSNPDAPPT